MRESTTDAVTLKITRSGKQWFIQGVAVHGHSKMVTASSNVKFKAPPRSILDPEVVGHAVRAVFQSLEELPPVLFEV